MALTRLGRLDALAGLDWLRLVVTPDDGSLLLGLLTVVGWVAWALVLLSLITEVVAVASSRRFLLRPPGTAWFQPASTALIASITGLGVAAVVAPVAPVVSVPVESLPAQAARPNTIVVVTASATVFISHVLLFISLPPSNIGAVLLGIIENFRLLTFEV